MSELTPICQDCLNGIPPGALHECRAEIQGANPDVINAISNLEYLEPSERYSYDQSDDMLDWFIYDHTISPEGGPCIGVAYEEEDAKAICAALNTPKDKIVIDKNKQFSQEAADAFWESWHENGETHKHGHYESTWMALWAALGVNHD